MPETTSTSPHSPTTPLLDTLWRLLEAHRPAFSRERIFLRAKALILGHLFCFARRTITQALLALGLTDHDWSAFYRLLGQEGRIDYEILSDRFLSETLPHLPPSGPYVAVVDGVQIPRSSRRMPGTSWLKSPKTPPFSHGAHRAQRFLHLAALLPKSEEKATLGPCPCAWSRPSPKRRFKLRASSRRSSGRLPLSRSGG